MQRASKFRGCMIVIPVTGNVRIMVSGLPFNSTGNVIKTGEYGGGGWLGVMTAYSLFAGS